MEDSVAEETPMDIQEQEEEEEETANELSDNESEINENESVQGSQYDSDEESLNEAEVNALAEGNESILPTDYDYNDDDDSVDYSDYLQKIDQSMKEHILETVHPEEYYINHDEMTKLSIVKRNEQGIVIDPLHKTSPILSKYEFTKLIGLRCKQLAEGAHSLIDIPTDVMNNAVIAELELRQKKLPFVIKRPLPHGGSEYWRLSDLEILL